MEILERLTIKFKIITVLIILLFNSLAVSAQANSIKSFKSFVARNYRISENVLKDCNWNYAVVKAAVGQDNKVRNLTFLNDVEEDMKKSFSYIKGYSFGSDRSFKGKSIIFILTIELNNWQTCNTAKIDYSPSEIITRVLGVLDKELSVNQSTLVLYYPITVTSGRTEN